MTIPAAEREKMLRVALCGPRVIMRLERSGITCLDDLAERQPEELVLAVNLAAGRPIWRPPMATRAMSNLIEAARAVHLTVGQDAAEGMPRATIHFDGGGQSPGPITAACTVELSDGSFYENVERFDHGTHNTAEWHALILGLRVALKHGERHVVVRGDSMLVVKQINREWKTKNAALLSLRARAEELLARFETWHVEWIPRRENRRTDELGRAG